MLGAYKAATRAHHTEATPRTRRAYDRVRDALMSDGVTVASAYGCGGWIPSTMGDPYEDARALEAAARGARLTGYPVRVSNVNHGQAFIGSDATNLAFRAHHDAVHVVHGLTFTFPDECEVARLTVAALGLDGDAAAVVAGEVIGQGLYFQRYGHFPLNVYGLQPCYHVTHASVCLATKLLETYQQRSTQP